MAAPKTMRAVSISTPTCGRDVSLSEIPVPEIRPGWVLIRVCGFGLNHSEQMVRLKEISGPRIKKPIVPGIECVGIVADAVGAGFQPGQRVVALMGGMGREFDGSYAEYCLAPAHHVFAADTELAWADVAAIPETYFTAWGSLFECLHLTSDDRLLVRGATCALGYAVLQIAKTMGCEVVATTHREAKVPLLEETGADETVVDDGVLCGKVTGITKALDLVGPKFLLDTLKCVERGALVCSTGVLGGIESMAAFDPIKDIPNGVYLTGFFSNSPTQADIDAIFSFMDEHKLTPRIGRVFPFENVADACAAQDAGSVDGKIVVTMDRKR